MKEDVSRKYDAQEAMCLNSTEGYKRRYVVVKNKETRVVLEALSEKVEDRLTGST